MSRIYHLLDEAEVFSERDGGAVSRWAANMLRDGEEIIVCPSFDASWGFPEERIYALPKWSWTATPMHPVLYRIPWTLQKIALLPIFQHLFERMEPGDIVYVHNRPESAAVLASVAKQRQFRVVLHMHNSHLIRATRPQKEALRGTPLVFVSEFLRSEFHAAWPDYDSPTGVVYNGADDKKFRGIERKANAIPEIIFTGRLIPDKGVHVLLEAMRILESRGVPARCTIVGGASFGKRDRITGYVRKLQSRKPANTEMVGYRTGDKLAALLQTADIFCAPSVWNDPFPLAPLEAMACGLPVVASHSGGIPEALAWGGGVLVEPNNAEKLANALEALVKNASMRQTMGAEALKSFREHFLWKSVHSQYERFIEEFALSSQLSTS